MKANGIVGEIHRIREMQAAERGFDPKRIGERIRQRQRERAGCGYVSPPQTVVRETPKCSGASAAPV